MTEEFRKEQDSLNKNFNSNHQNVASIYDNSKNDEMSKIQAYLILDDNEVLTVNSCSSFVALFNQPDKLITNNRDVLFPVSSTERNVSEKGALKLCMPELNTAQAAATNDDKLVKCVTIFGNTGDGKSHTLNHTFFNGRNVFKTSQKQDACTIGVWCAYDALTNSLIFDTEGLLGSTGNENKRMRLLLKILAISDVIIYRTRAERLHNDLFKFMSDASVAYMKYFSKELKAAAKKLKLETISSLGPCCVIFHETQHTDVLCDQLDAAGQRSVSHQLAERFAKLDLSYNAFSSIEYVGTRTCVSDGTDFKQLSLSIRDLLRNSSVRPPRKLSSIYQVLKAINDKFNGVISASHINTFADEYFTCSAICLSCGKRCQNSINHLSDTILHQNSDKCRYDHQYDNKVYVCKLCHESGKEVVVIPKTTASNENSIIGIVKYTYSGYVLECPHHGVIYRSRQYWYSNPDPESVVRTELKHMWPDQLNNVGTSHNLSRKIIDNVSYIGESLQYVSAKPAGIAKQWIADQVAPSYWTPNSDIVDCFNCHKPFVDIIDRKHHCRGCGKGFCDKCSSKRKIIQWWSQTEKVRVCDICFDNENIKEPNEALQTQQNQNFTNENMIQLNTTSMANNNNVIVRKVTETVQEKMGLIKYATKIPLDFLKESARPSYWKPDSECLKCELCKQEFDDKLVLHHCRSCGNGVCDNCSPGLLPVPSRGWDNPVRICKQCILPEIVT